MLDIHFIRENKDLIAAGARKKHIDFNVDDLITVDDERRAALLALEEKRARQNQASDAIAQIADPEARAAAIGSMKLLKDEMQAEEAALKSIMERWQRLMLAVPNIPDFSVPEGAGDADNMEVSVWGEPPHIPGEIKDHIQICEERGFADFVKGAEVSGFRGYYLKGNLARLDMALWQYVFDFFIAKGFEPMIVPSLVRRETLMGTGYLPGGEDDLYRTQDNEYLAGTGEVATMAYFADTIIEAETFPIKVIAFSPCFRREAGSHSKDTKGLIRVHEFFKLEQVVLCEANHETSVKLHEEIRANVEELMQQLEIPYHVVVNCGGDLGQGQVKKYDVEAWVPSQQTYRETHSASYFHDYQTRRLNIRYRDAEGKLRFAHSLNNTAAATPRLLVPILENYQQPDGSVVVPKVLRPYLGGLEVL